MIKWEGERAKKARAWVGWKVGTASWLPTHKAKFFISGMVTTGWHWATPSHRGLKPRRFISHSWHTCTYGCVGDSRRMFSIQDFSRWSSHNPEHCPGSWQRTPRPWWSSNGLLMGWQELALTRHWPKPILWPQPTSSRWRRSHPPRRRVRRPVNSSQ